ncbi:hypothetical protein Q5752_001057 [Cryptotrichosporon argae]
MGTRGLVGFLIRGQEFGSFHQYDSYPKGLGDVIVKFILGLSPERIELMATRMLAVEWVVDDDAPSVRFANELNEILASTRTTMPDSTDFFYDSLFCEWVYFIDFENRTLTTCGGWSPTDKVTKFSELSPSYMSTLALEDEDEDVEGHDGDGAGEDGAGPNGQDEDSDTMFDRPSAEEVFMSVVGNVEVAFVTPAQMDAHFAGWGAGDVTAERETNGPIGPEAKRRALE